MNKLRLLVGASAMLMPLAFTPLAASGAALSTFQTTQGETTPPLHGTNPHGQGTAAVTQLLPDLTRPYSGDPSGKGPPAELLVVGRTRGEQRADGTYHGHITIAALAGTELLMVDTNPGENKQGPLDSLTQALCTSTGGVVCIGAVTANSSTTTTGSNNHFETLNITAGNNPAGVLLPVGLAALGAQAATSDGNIQTDPVTGCQTATGSSLVNKAGLGALILTDVIKSSTISKACPGQAPTETDSSTVIPATGVSGLVTALPANGCATGGNPNPDGSPGGTANTKGGVPIVLDTVCNAADSNPGVPTNSSDGGKQATAPYGVREGLAAFVLALGGGNAAVKLTTAAAESTATAQTAATCPAPQTGTPPNCMNPPVVCPKGQSGTPCMPNPKNKHACNVNGDNDCVTGSGPNGPSIPEGGPTDTARDCKEGVENTPASKCPGNNGGGGGGGAQTRSTLPFTGLDPLPIGILGVALLGSGLAMRRFSGLAD